jgi:hypothetical protein
MSNLATDLQRARQDWEHEHARMQDDLCEQARAWCDAFCPDKTWILGAPARTRRENWKNRIITIDTDKGQADISALKYVGGGEYDRHHLTLALGYFDEPQAAIAAERARRDQQAKAKRKQDAKRERADRAQRERYEREQLARLKAKYETADAGAGEVAS